MPSTNAELTKTYLEYQRPILWKTNFFDIVTGNNGARAEFGWTYALVSASRKLAGL